MAKKVDLQKKKHFSFSSIITATYLRFKGLWLNKEEMDNFWSDGNTDEYLINKDSNPHIIIKKPTNSIELKQNIEISYLRPPTPPSPGEIIIEKEPNKVAEKSLFRILLEKLKKKSVYSIIN